MSASSGTSKTIDQAALDRRHMRVALGLARRGLGTTWPNPAVGCVIARGDAVVGRGWTQAGGRPHAETEALVRAGAAARGATAYVTLEPCSHQGKTPPCADALIAAGIDTCVVAIQDPDPRVNGAGLARLRAAGIAVRTGVETEAAGELIAGFRLRVIEGRPLVTLKVATTLDGRIATHGGESQWITGEAARRRGHLMRAQHDAVLVGARTAIVDDPALTCRIPGLESRSPVRVVIDGNMWLPLTHRLVVTAKAVPTWLIVAGDADPVRRQAFADCGLVIVEVARGADGWLDLADIMRQIGARGLTRVLSEGGSRLSASLVRAGLVDRLAWFRAASVIGGDGLPVLAPFGVEHLADAPRWRRVNVEVVADDLLETFARPL